MSTRKRHLKVFLCHISADKQRVLALYKRLIADGVDAWLDQEKLLPGQDWRVEIPRAVQEADVVLICLSNQSITKEGYIQKEIKSALGVAEEKPEGSIFIIPARLEECVVPDQLSRWQWVDLFVEHGYEKLIHSLRARAHMIGVTLNVKTSSSFIAEPVSEERQLEYSKRPLKVFLCHASADKLRIRKWYKRLVADGVDAWLDTESLLPGQKWKSEIPKAIRNSDIVMVFLSSKSINKEGFVQKEIKEALDFAGEKPDGTIFIIPARLEDCTVPDHLSEYQWVDLHKEGGYEKLVSALLAHAKSIGAVFLPSRMLRIDEVKSRAVYLEKNRDFAESLKAYNELKNLAPAYSGVDEKIGAIRRRLGWREWLLYTTVIVALMGLAIMIAGAMLSSPIVKNWLFPIPTITTTATRFVTSISSFNPALVEVSTSTKTATLTYAVTNTRTFTPTLTPTLTPTVTPTFAIMFDRTMPMLLIREGSFQWKGGQKYVPAFHIDQHEVTNSQYEQCVKAGTCSRPFASDNEDYPYVQHYGERGYENFPVVLVSWNMATTYCEWRGKETGKITRLPHDYEWEKAARGLLIAKSYPWGDELPICSEHQINGANFSKCSKDAIPVMNFASNGYGIYDMSGNASEWVIESPQNTDPDDRWIRGGSWFFDENKLTADSIFIGNRFKGYLDTGFRCARDANP